MDFMQEVMSYIKPELVVLIIALYFLGMIIRNSKSIKDAYIPMILGIVGIVLCALYVLATSDIKGYQDACMAVFTAIAQGLLVSGMSVYVNQLIVQGKRLNDEKAQG